MAAKKKVNPKTAKTKDDAKKSSSIDLTDQNFAVLAHLSSFAGLFIPLGNILGPLTVWLFKKQTSDFAAKSALSALNFQISMTIYMLIAAVLAIILIGFPILIALVIIDVFNTVKAAIAASNGEIYKYPYSKEFIK